MLILTAMLSLFFSVSIIFYFIYHRGLVEVFFNPMVLTNIFFIIIHIALPLLQWDERYFRYSDYDLEVYSASMLLVLILNILYTLTLLLFNRKPLSFEYHHNISISVTKRILIFSLLVLCVGLICAFLNLSAIMSLGIDAYMTDRISLGLGNGLTMLLAHWVYISCLMLFFVFLVSEKKSQLRRIALFFFLISLLVSILYYSINSNRNSI
ncbi:hypothetical protein AB4349_14025, partial [Vibrio breoganii]